MLLLFLFYILFLRRGVWLKTKYFFFSFSLFIYFSNCASSWTFAQNIHALSIITPLTPSTEQWHHRWNRELRLSFCLLYFLPWHTWMKEITAHPSPCWTFIWLSNIIIIILCYCTTDTINYCMHQEQIPGCRKSHWGFVRRLLLSQGFLYYFIFLFLVGILPNPCTTGCFRDVLR